MKIPVPPIGSLVWGSKGVRYPVIAYQQSNGSIALVCEGIDKAIPLSAVVGVERHWSEADYLDAIDLINQWPAECPQEFSQWLQALKLTPQQKNTLWHRLTDLQRQKTKRMVKH